MTDILDFLGPMMPRRPVSPGLPVPHPASGTPPNLMDILAEAGTLNPPHPSVGTPSENSAVANIVNNPTAANVPPEELLAAALQLGQAHGGHGSFPGLTRALIEHLAKANIGALDTEAKFQPTLARLLMQDQGRPDMMSLMALDDPSTPSLSSFFSGHSATDNPAALLEATNNFAGRLQDHSAINQGANADAAAGDMAAVTDLYPTDFPAIDASASDNMDGLYQLNNNLRLLAMAAQRPGAASSQLINQVVGSMSGTYDHRIRQAIMDAIEQSGVGQGRQVPTLDPASMRSLAPDINPSALGYGMMAEGQPADSLPLLMELMGLQRTKPRSGV